MPKLYHFTAFTKEGQQRKGQIAAQTPEEAACQLQGEGFYISHLTPFPLRPPSSYHLAPNSESWVALYNLAILLEAGIPIQSALSHLASESKNLLFRQGLRTIQGAIDEGDSFGQAFKRSGLFPREWLSLFLLGEKSGNFVRPVQFISWQLKFKNRLKTHLVTSLWMPLLLLTLVVAWYGLVVVKVVPCLSDFLTALGVFSAVPELFRPTFDRTVVGIRWILMMALFLIFLVQRKPRFLESAPIVGSMIRQARFFRIATELQWLLEYGVLLPEALDIVGTSFSAASPRRELLFMGQKLREGVPFSEALGGMPTIPPSAQTLLAVGDAAGRLPEALLSVATQAQEVFEESVKRLGIWIQNLVVVSVGVLIGVLLASYFTMLYSCLGSLPASVSNPFSVPVKL